MYLSNGALLRLPRQLSPAMRRLSATLGSHMTPRGRRGAQMAACARPFPSHHAAMRNLVNRSVTRALSAAAGAPTSSPREEEARVVVIGGGIIGTSVAYHLGKRTSDIVLLERDELTSGTTWHAAGLMVTFGSLSETSTEFRKYTKELYSGVLEAETGQSTGFKPCGFIECATDADRLEEYRRIAAFNRKCGVDVHEISPSEVKELFPMARVDDVLAGFYVEDDGRVNPVDATQAFAKGARMSGVDIRTGTSNAVKRVLHDPRTRRVTGVETVGGDVIKCEYVVNCGGMWARQLADLSGVCVPNQAAEHYYLITDRIEGVDPNWPVLEDPSSHAYIRPEGDGLMVGLFEPKAAAWCVSGGDKSEVRGVPQDFSFGEIDPDWDRITPFLEKAMNRVPSTLEVGAKTLFCGPESFTPDVSPIIGESPEIKNYFVAAGLNSIGILTGGGVGKLVADWIVDGYPTEDVTGVNINRFQQFQNTVEYRGERVVESLQRVYECHYPHYDTVTARNAKQTPFHTHMDALGAYFRDVSGWEVPDWFLANTDENMRLRAQSKEMVLDRSAIRQHPYSFGRHQWFAQWRNEHMLCRNGVAMFDMSFMSKFIVKGRHGHAGKFLERLCTARVTGCHPKERENWTGESYSPFITYTQMLDERGHMQADVTVVQMDFDTYMVIATDTMHRHVESWMDRHIADEECVCIYDATNGYAQLNVQGPLSRQLMSRVAPHNSFDNDSFPFRKVKTLDIGFAKVMCSRITYVGELGYELFVPAEQASHVYGRIMDVAAELQREDKDFVFGHAGLKALGSLRMEKGYRDYGHDMDNTDSLMEVGLSFTCDFEKEVPFIGQEAVMAEKKAKKRERRLVQVRVEDPEPMLFHGEVVYRDGVVVGDIRSASYGHSLGGAVGLCMAEATHTESKIVNKAFVSGGTWEVEIAGVKYPAAASLRPMFDPKSEKISG